MKNLVIECIETSNRRLWALRENMHVDEAGFAAYFDVSLDEYHEYEKAENPIPAEFLQNVASRLSVSIDWLLCRCPMLPIPEAEFKEPPPHIE